MKLPLAIVIGGLGFSGARAAAESEDVQFFREQVRPILEKNCFECHGGVDESGHHKIKAGLQLISRKGLMQGGDRGPAVDLENPHKSLLLEALSYQNENLQMPPSGQLPAEDMETIRAWVERGTPWTPEDADLLIEVEDSHAAITEVNEQTRNHWSYRPMLRVDPPKVSNPDWQANPIDAFVFSKLEAEGLAPVEEASRAILLRRLSYDLTGLAPTLQDVRAFEADESPEAWSKQVDRLLDSETYGEKWARHWLDIVRYADSNGFERDNDKPFIWRYRDYVIDSFNSDKPYHRFLAEQLAGDEMPDRTAETQIATGMLRLMAWDDVAADPVQQYHDLLDDNVRTVTEGFLGFTAGCARCHDHKGDPIPQTDYYRFAAFFRGIDPMNQGERQTRLIGADQDLASRDFQLTSLSHEEEELRVKMGGIEERAYESVLRTHSDVAERVTRISEASRWLITDSRLSSTDWHYTEEKPSADWNKVSFRAELEGWKIGPGGFGTAAPGVQARTVWTSSEIWLQTTFGLESIPESLLLHLYHDNAIEIYLNGRPVLHRQGWTTEYEKIPAPDRFMAALQTGRNVLAVHVSQDYGGQLFDLGIEIDAITRGDIVLNGKYRAVSDDDRMTYRKASQRMEQILELRGSPGIEVFSISGNGPIPPATHVMIRGNAHSEGAVVEPGFPEIWGGNAAVVPLPPDDAETSGRRLALANWIADPENPRTARVMVNRIWQHHFGRGICETPNDFGFLGSGASHPELLDWLAEEFVAKGWSIKAMHRLILNSRVYQLSSRSGAQQAKKDPGNRWFWRANPRRLTAEELRDSILSCTGELNLEMGGPPVYPPMPEEYLATASSREGKWGKSPPNQANRRSIYVKLKRSLQPPLLTDFDLSDIDNSCPVRFTTTVPTQALAMMNSEFIHSKADTLAERLQAERPGDLGAQIRLAFEIVISREADELEVERAVKFVSDLRSENRLDETSALQRFALAMFNLNEFIYLD